MSVSRLTGLASGRLLVAFLLLMPASAGAEADPRAIGSGNQFIIAEADRAGLTPGGAALLNNGQIVTVWEYNLDGVDARFRFYDQSGASIGTESSIDPAAPYQWAPCLAPLTGGGFAAAWTGLTDMGARSLNADGSPAGPSVEVYSYPDSSRAVGANSDLAGSADGGFMVVWEHDYSTAEYTSFDNDVYARLYDASGQAAGPAFQVNTTTADRHNRPAICRLADGRLVVVWLVDNVTERLAVRGRVFDQTGASLGDDFLIGTPGNGLSVDVDVCALNDGGFLTVWPAEDCPTGQSSGCPGGLVGRRYGAGLNPVGDRFYISSDGGDGLALRPRAVGLSSGGFAVAWQDLSTPSGFSPEVGIQDFDSAGTKIGDYVFANSPLDGWQGVPRLAGLPGDKMFVQWLAYPDANNPDRSGIMGRIMASGVGDRESPPAGSPGEPCGPLDVYDCRGNCVPRVLVDMFKGDGVCQGSGWEIDLNCDAFQFDGGDCSG